MPFRPAARAVLLLVLGSLRPAYAADPLLIPDRDIIGLPRLDFEARIHQRPTAVLSQAVLATEEARLGLPEAALDLVLPNAAPGRRSALDGCPRPLGRPEVLSTALFWRVPPAGERPSLPPGHLNEILAIRGCDRIAVVEAAVGFQGVRGGVRIVVSGYVLGVGRSR